MSIKNANDQLGGFSGTGRSERNWHASIHERARTEEARLYD